MANMYNSWGDFNGEPQLSAANYMVIYRFFCENAQLVNNLIQFRYLSISGQVLNTLKNQFLDYSNFKMTTFGGLENFSVCFLIHPLSLVVS